MGISNREGEAVGEARSGEKLWRTQGRRLKMEAREEPTVKARKSVRGRRGALGDRAESRWVGLRDLTQGQEHSRPSVPSAVCPGVPHGPL